MKGGKKALSQISYQNTSPINRTANHGQAPRAVCPVCRRPLGPFDRTVWGWRAWRRGPCAGCEQCAGKPQGEVLLYEVWETPELWI